MPLEDLLAEWLELGNQDLRSAEFLSDMHSILAIRFHNSPDAVLEIWSCF